MKSKILQISSRADRSGGPIHLKDVLNVLSCDERFIMSGAFPENSEMSKELKQKCYKFIPIEERKFYLITLIKLFNFCKNEKINIIHSHGRGAGIYSRILKLTGVKVIHTYHGIHKENNFEGMLKFFIDKTLTFLTDVFIFVSNDEKDTAFSQSLAPPHKSVVILNGVDVDHINQKSNENNYSFDKINIPSNKIIVGLMGRITYQKGHDILVKMIADNPNLFKDYHFIIAGKGEKKELLEKVEKHKVKNISFVGEVSTPYSFLKKIDIYLSTSRWEGLPLTALEAMALNKPCILSNTIGHRELSKYCQLYDLKSTMSLLSCLKNHKANQYEFPKKFTRNEMCKSLADIYFQNSSDSHMPFRSS